MDITEKLSTHLLILKGKEMKDVSIYKCVVYDSIGNTGTNNFTTNLVANETFSGSGDGKIVWSFKILVYANLRGASRIFHRGAPILVGAPTSETDTFWQKTFSKMKKGEGGRKILYVDPPLNNLL